MSCRDTFNLSLILVPSRSFWRTPPCMPSLYFFATTTPFPTVTRNGPDSIQDILVSTFQAFPSLKTRQRRLWASKVFNRCQAVLPRTDGDYPPIWGIVPAALTRRPYEGMMLAYPVWNLALGGWPLNRIKYSWVHIHLMRISIFNHCCFQSWLDRWDRWSNFMIIFFSLRVGFTST